MKEVIKLSCYKPVVNNIVEEVVKLSCHKPLVNNIVKEVVKLLCKKTALIEEKEKTKKRNTEVAGIENKWIDFY